MLDECSDLDGLGSNGISKSSELVSSLAIGTSCLTVTFISKLTEFLEVSIESTDTIDD